jgi:prevent-host-death family protein
MPTYDLLEANANLSRLIDAVESGRETEIVITRDGKPAARLMPLSPNRAQRRLGIAQGKFKIPENIDELNPLIERMFNGDPD